MGKDAFDGAVCLHLAGSRRMDEVLAFLGECWKDLDRPAQVQLDNARELAGWGPAARTLSRVIRLCLRFGVGPVFIPAGEPQFNGGVENFNGWFQPRLFQRPTDLRQELARCVIFIRRVSPAGAVTVLSQSFRVGKRHKGLYLRLVVDTGRGRLTAYGCEGGPVEKQRPLGHTPRGLAVAPRHKTNDQEHAVMLNRGVTESLCKFAHLTFVSMLQVANANDPV